MLKIAMVESIRVMPALEREGVKIFALQLFPKLPKLESVPCEVCTLTSPGVPDNHLAMGAIVDGHHSIMESPGNDSQSTMKPASVDAITPTAVATDHVPQGTSVLEQDWSAGYSHSNKWKEYWEKATTGMTWPRDVQLRGPKQQFLYLNHKLCLPEDNTAQLIHEWHVKLGHPGINKMVENLQGRVAIEDLRKAVQAEVRGCQLCQATSKPNWDGICLALGTLIPYLHDLYHVLIWNWWTSANLRLGMARKSIQQW